jgi:hypothetical protein
MLTFATWRRPSLDHRRPRAIGGGGSDLLFRNDSIFVGPAGPGPEAGIGNPGSNCKAIGTADHNADGCDDILLHDTSTGNLRIDPMNEMSISSSFPRRKNF